VERQIIHDEVDKMLKNGIIQSSESPWSSPSPVFLAIKKDGNWCFRADCQLNKITKKDVYPLPCINVTWTV